MRKLFLVLIALAIVEVTNAQVFSWGMRLGAASTSINADPLTIYDGTANLDSIKLSVEGASFGIHGGLYTRLKFGPVFLQPELLFNTESYAYTKEDLTQSGVTEMLKDKFSTLDLPIMVGLKMGPIRLQGGPVGSLLLANNSQLDQISETFSRELTNLTWGYQAGLGLDIGSVLVDLKYEGSLGFYSDSFEVFGNTYETDSRSNRWLLTVGLKF